MNTVPDPQDDQRWQALLARSSSTFAVDTALPFGFMTSTLARLRAQKERDVLEKIGFRALFASLAILVAVVGFSVGVQFQNHTDFDPAVKSLLQADEVPIS